MIDPKEWMIGRLDMISKFICSLIPRFWVIAKWGCRNLLLWTYEQRPWHALTYQPIDLCLGLRYLSKIQLSISWKFTGVIKRPISHKSNNANAWWFWGISPVIVHFVWVGVIEWPQPVTLQFDAFCVTQRRQQQRWAPKKKVRWKPAASCCHNKKIRVESCAANALGMESVSRFGTELSEKIWMEVADLDGFFD